MILSKTSRRQCCCRLLHFQKEAAAHEKLKRSISLEASLWKGFGHKCCSSKNGEGFVFVATDGRFMAMVKYSAKTRLPSHVELSTKPTYWRFYTKNKYSVLRTPPYYVPVG